MKRISVDIGGTFTDCFFVWDEQYVAAKALTTHHNLALGFNEALDLACKRAGLDRDQVLSKVDSVRYATTLGTNALIEGKGPRVAAIVTHGFEDTIPLSRGRGYGEGLDTSMQQNLPAAERPTPLVPRQLIRSVKERVNSRRQGRRPARRAGRPQHGSRARRRRRGGVGGLTYQRD
jgi:N-methylhydantoinase A